MGRITDGQIHQRNALICLASLVGIGIWMWSFNEGLALGLILGGMFGLFIDPDLDHEWKTTAEGRITKLFGKLIGKLFRLYWAPYEVLFEHRSVWTHGGRLPFGWLTMIIVATPIRMLYALAPSIGLALAMSDSTLEILSEVSALFWVGLYMGWATQDLVHWIRDFM